MFIQFVKATKDELSELVGEAHPRRLQILRAALDAFVERGFHGATIPSIAKRAGVAAGTIYTHFTSKLDLVNALLAAVKGTLAERVLAALGEAATTRAHAIPTKAR